MSAVVWTVLLAACSSVPDAQSVQRHLDAYNAAADAPVRSFPFTNRVWLWEPLSYKQLVVYPEPNQAYLLDVAPCPTLVTVQTISLTSKAREVSVGVDTVLTGPRDLHYVPCAITRIRPIELSKLTIGQSELGEQREVDMQLSEDWYIADPPELNNRNH